MSETITIARVPTGIKVPAAMQEAQDRLLGRFDDPTMVAKNLQAVVDNPHAALIFALVDNDPQSNEDWDTIPAKSYAGTTTLIMLQTTVRNVGRFDEVVVESGHEGQGIGRRLMEAAIAIGHDNNTTRFDLTSSPDKLAAQALYEKVGFKKRITNNWRFDG